MKSHVQVAVIGGGVVGCSVLYHLTKLGWRDVVLLERDELTVGSSWHAAGGMHTLNSDPNVAKLQGYTINLYREIEAISGQDCGLHQTGGIYLAATRDRLDYLKAEEAKGRYLGLETRLLTLEEVSDLCPIVETRGLTGALYDPNDGHLDPAGVTHAYAQAARKGGAEVYRKSPVVELNRTRSGAWQVVTPNGSLEADVVVNAGGLWAREIGGLIGLSLPIVPMEHQYLVSDDIPAVASLDREIAMVIDFEGESYLRQEGKGILIGTYETDCRHWAEDGTPADFGAELLPSDLERIVERLGVAHERYPCLADAGIKRIINGPMVFAPDGNPLVGPVPGVENYFLACGVMAGFSQGGGVGLTVAEWIVEGEPGMDVFAMDVARFGDFATKAYTLAKTRENYTRRFAITFPNEELPAGRPLRTTPVYEHLKHEGAVFGAAYGLEHALWFAPPKMPAVETPTFRRSNAFEPAAAECRAVREGVGMLEISNFAKYEITGRDAAAWLDRLVANRLPAEGRLTLAPMLSPKGRLVGDLTVARLGPSRFMIFGSGIAEAYHMRWFNAHREGLAVDIRPRGVGLTGFALAGPAARSVFQHVVEGDVSSEAFPFLHIAEMTVGPLRAIVARISYTGELGFEIYCERDDQIALYELLREAGKDLGLRLFGARALNSLRLEKSFGAWTRDFTPDFTAYESGLDRFVALDKGPFVGREAAREQSAAAPARRLVTLVVDAADADANADEPVLAGDEVVGFVTSGGYGHTVGESIALAYVDRDRIAAGDAVDIEILGERRPARLVDAPLYDPTGARMRG